MSCYWNPALLVPVVVTRIKKFKPHLLYDCLFQALALVVLEQHTEARCAHSTSSIYLTHTTHRGARRTPMSFNMDAAVPALLALSRNASHC